MPDDNTILQNRYRIQRKLGKGGMGTVYEAVDERLGTTVALKECNKTEEYALKQFEREARLLARLRHPAMTRVIDHFQDGGGQFLVMDFIAGEDLLEVLKKRGGALPLSEVLPWADQLLDVLEYLHSQEPPVVHRDIKPENLKLTSRNQIILLDFGLAKGFVGHNSRLAGSGSIHGYTPHYAPLEQIHGTGTDPRSDLYSLAATLYHLLTNTVPPYVGYRAGATSDGQPDPLRPAHEINRQVTVELAAVLNRALAIGRNQRFATAAEMREALHGVRNPQTDTGGAAQTNDLPPTVLAGSPLPPTIVEDSRPISKEPAPTVIAPTMIEPAQPSPAISTEQPAGFTDSQPSADTGKGNLDELFAEFFGGTSGESSGRMPGRDVDAEISITLEEAHRGVSRRQTFQLPDTCATCAGMGMKKGKPCRTCRGAGSVARPKTLDVNIPAGVSAGSRIRLAGQGASGKDGTPAGDLYLNIRIEPHHLFNLVSEYDLQIELQVSPWETAPGTIVNVLTLDSPVKMKVPAGMHAGQKLRLRGQGLNKLHGGRGDLYVTLKIVSPPEKKIETPLPGSATIIGIDFGTSKSVVTILKGGKPTVITNEETGLRAIPSVVAFAKDGTRLIGQVANRQAVSNPENTVYSIKRFMGRRFNEVVEEIKHVPFKVEAAKDGDVRIRVGGKAYSPPEIAAMILEQVKQAAEDYLGYKVDKAVITVPPYFNEAQRQATKEACKLAGLQMMRIVNGPSAAAVAYVFDKKKDETIAVFDFGGGTFNISIVEVGEGIIEVKSTCGDTRLGGDDIDARLIEWIIGEFKKDQSIDLSKDKAALQRLKEAAEKAKMELSYGMETEVSLPFIAANQSGPKHLAMKLTRARFEHLIAPILQRIKPLVEQALKDADIPASRINEVVLVGGSTRIPKIQQLVRDIFGKEPNKSVNPDDAVAVGTALLAGVLSGEQKDILLLDVTPLSLGIETLGGVFTKLIERNTTIPTRKSEIFSTASDNQTSVAIHVLQGERPRACDNQTLGRFHLVDIPRASRGVPQIEVIFDIDSNGVVDVSAKDKSTGREQNITITGSFGHS